MDIKITGIMLYYYKVCHKKLWYFSNHIAMESGNDDVAIGKMIDENSYNREDKHVLINDEINIDFISNNKVIHEVKKSKKIEEASIFQLQYYIYYLKKRGIDGITGKIDYPTLKQTVDVVLTDENYLEIEMAVEDIKCIVKLPAPPPIIQKSYCKKCAYYEICYI